MLSYYIATKGDPLMKKIILLLLLLSLTASLFAVPANPEPGIVSYPDGSELTVYLRGDENRSWHETEDGHHIIKNKSGLCFILHSQFIF